MTDPSARLRQVRAMFEAALELPRQEREAFLAAAAGADVTLRREVADLLALDDDTSIDGALESGPGAAALIGTRTGPYQLVRLIGEGGMGLVFEGARAQQDFEHRVAIKLVRREREGEFAHRRFRRERQILASLQHRNIAALHDGGVTADGRPWLAMEFVDGEPITTWCDRRRLSVAERVRLFRQVCAAVQHAHRSLIIHRDIKPGNILVTEDGTVKLLDFGVATLMAGEDERPLPAVTLDGRIAFTPAYASPEQLRGEPLTTASDLYSLGVVLFELLTGHRPTPTDGVPLAQLIREAGNHDPPRPSEVVDADNSAARGGRTIARLRAELAGELDSILLTALMPDPGRRYASVDALNDDLRRYGEGLPVQAHQDWLGYRLRKFVSRHRVAVLAATATLITLVAGIVLTGREKSRAELERQKSAEIGRFLSELLSSVPPNADGADVTVLQLLEQTAHRLSSGQVRDEAVRAELETTVGRSYAVLGQFELARAHLDSALVIQRRRGGAHDVALALYELGRLHFAAGDLERGGALLEEAAAVPLRNARLADSIRALILDARGQVARREGSYAIAESLHRASYRVAVDRFGDAHPSAADALDNLGLVFGEQNQWATAESLHRQAVDHHRQSDGPDGVDVAISLSRLATALDLQGKVPAADSVYGETLTLQRRLLGPEHPDYAWTAFNFAGFLVDQQQYPRAIVLSRELLSLRDRVLPATHPAIAASLLNLGRSFSALGQPDSAASYLEAGVALRQSYLGPTHWLVASAKGYLGEHYTRARRFPEAARVLREARAIFLDTYGPEHPRTQETEQRLVTLYQSWGRPNPDGP